MTLSLTCRTVERDRCQSKTARPAGGQSSTGVPGLFYQSISCDPCSRLPLALLMPATERSRGLCQGGVRSANLWEQAVPAFQQDLLLPEPQMNLEHERRHSHSD